MKKDRDAGADEGREEPKLEEGLDYYFENGLMVLSAEYLRKRGYCCNNGCRHCPYPKNKAA